MADDHPVSDLLDTETSKSRGAAVKQPRGQRHPHFQPGQSEKKKQIHRTYAKERCKLYTNPFLWLCFFCAKYVKAGVFWCPQPEAHTSVSMAGPFWENLDLCWTRGAGCLTSLFGDVFGGAKELRS